MSDEQTAFRQRFEKWKEGADERREIKHFKQMEQLERENLKHKEEGERLCSELLCGLIVVVVVSAVIYLLFLNNRFHH